jgi:hypothetical protein
MCKKFDGRVQRAGFEIIESQKTIVGRYVTIKKYNERFYQGMLPLCEILVFSYPIIVNWDECFEKSENGLYCKRCNGHEPPDCVKECQHTYGQNCESFCGKCAGGMKCDQVTGECETCEPGWLPPLCQLPCPPHTWGPACQNKCGRCANDTICDHVTGICNNTCEPGWLPPLCQLPCPPQTWGPSCLNKCGNCANDTICDHVTGNCTQGCEPWYTEDTKCNAYIPLVDIQTQPQILFIKETWAMLNIDTKISYELRECYEIKAFYINEKNPYADFELYPNITSKIQNGLIRIGIDDLKKSSQYWFKIRIFRQQQGFSEGGSMSEPVKIFTLSDMDYYIDQNYICNHTSVT